MQACSRDTDYLAKTLKLSSYDIILIILSGSAITHLYLVPFRIDGQNIVGRVPVAAVAWSPYIFHRGHYNAADIIDRGEA